MHLHDVLARHGEIKDPMKWLNHKVLAYIDTYGQDILSML